MDVTLERFKRYGFNTLGCWSMWRVIIKSYPKPYVVFLNLVGKPPEEKKGYGFRIYMEPISRMCSTHRFKRNA
jgi:hypothetical protein